MKDYHDLYLKCDVLLLADIFEKFTNNTLINYQLCPSHYLSAPGLIWDAMLKMTKIKLVLNSDPNMYIFFEKGTRGGISYISNRYTKADNKYLKSYDSKQESKHIIYLDANNLYGFAISKFLPTNGFKWIHPKEFDLNKYTSNSSKGCIPEVDPEDPKVLQELHNNYPLVPDKIEIKRELLSEYQLKISDLYNIPIGNVKKLVTNFFDKERLHYKKLQLYLRLGLKLKKIHRVLEFNQSQWLTPYIEFNTQKRIEAEKIITKIVQLYKLMNNLVQIKEQCYIWKSNGKPKNRINVKVVNNEKNI